MQRSLIIIAVVLVLAGIGAAAYFFFFKSSGGVAVSPTASSTLPVAGPGAPIIIGTTTNVPGSTGVGTPVAVSPRLVKISAGPVVPGVAVVNLKPINASSSPEVAVSYIERQSGNIFSYLTGAKTITRTSNKTIPGIQSASWLPNASSTFVRYLSGANFSTINTFALPVNGATGFFLPQDLSDIAVSSTSLLTLTSGVSGSAASLERTDGTRAVTVFTTPLSALRVSFLGKTQYLAVTKPSSTLPGYAFMVDISGHFTRIAGPLNGLVALASPSGRWVLVSYTFGTSMNMQLVNVVTGETIPLPVATIADKCVWTIDDSAVYCGIPVSPSAAAAYPDDWYQGATAFSDRVWRVDVSGRFAQLVLDFATATKVALDAESLAINPTNTVLVFVNKNDGSLWSYSL
jgi:hypothetical protein